MAKNIKKALLAKDMYLTTFTGRKFRPFAPKLQNIDIRDIAHALSNQCRFVGHCIEFYSVAEHCVRVSYAVPPNFALEGLLHDAAEAYLGDMATPIKHYFKMKFYSFCERRIFKKIAQKFGVTSKMSPAVHRADLLLLATEARDLIKKAPWSKGMATLPDYISPWTPKVAENRFLERFNELSRGK